MADLDQWTQAHDDTLRDALALMRRDVESLPLTDVRFVKARGNARRRRTFAVGAVAAAAAFVVVGAVGFSALGSDRALDGGPAATSPTVTNTSSPTTPVGSAGPLLDAEEWKRALGISGTVQLGAMRPGEGVLTCVSAPGALLAIGTASATSIGFGAVQGTYRASSPDAGNAAAAKAVSQRLAPGRAETMGVFRAEAEAAWPKVFSMAAVPDSGGKQWFIVAHQGALTSLLSVSDPSVTAGFPLAQIQALALIAQQRLVQLEKG